MEASSPQTTISTDEKQSKLIAGSFHSLAELLLQAYERIEKRQQENLSYDNNQQD